jgi:sn-glycerol 3-phosphate transport system ATP-binding protein/multiple sugar transport system ATP-binding protein
VASVSIRALRKTYPGAKSKTILKGIDLEIPDGAFTVLVGPSGCGKSTLLRTIAGLERPDSGQVLFADRDVTRAEPRDRDIAMVFQSYALYPHLTVRQNLAFGLELRKTAAAEIEKRITEVAPQLGLSELLDRLPAQLSGGQRQRVAMGRAIVRRPSLFLFDEPLSNLDAALRGEVRVQIRRLHERLKATMIYVTHDQVEAMTLADQLVVLNGGVVEQAGTPIEVYERPRTKFVAGFLGMPAMNFVEGRLAIVDGQVRARAPGVDVPVAEDRLGDRDQTFGDRRVIIGVRPQDVTLSKRPPERTEGLHLRVELVEGLGFESHVHGTLGDDKGSPFVARVEGGDARAFAPGEALSLEVPPAKVHLFDPATGRATWDV